MPTAPSDHEELAWAAGFFDGEGCTSYTQAGRYACVSIGQVDRQVLDRFRDAVNVGRVIGPHNRRSPSRPSKQQQCAFRAYGCAPLLALMRSLWPYLDDIKREQAIRTVTRAVEFGNRGAADALRRLSRSQPRRVGWRTELAWAAGFLDGEGCFSFSRSSGSPCVAIGQNDRRVLDRFRQAVGLGTTYGPYRRKANTLGPGGIHFQYRASGWESVQAIAAKLWAHMGRAKRDQASKVLRRWPTTCRRGHPKRNGQSGCGLCQREYWRRFRMARRASSNS